LGLCQAWNLGLVSRWAVGARRRHRTERAGDQWRSHTTVASEGSGHRLFLTSILLRAGRRYDLQGEPRHDRFELVPTQAPPPPPGRQNKTPITLSIFKVFPGTTAWSVDSATSNPHISIFLHSVEGICPLHSPPGLVNDVVHIMHWVPHKQCNYSVRVSLKCRSPYKISF